MENKFETKGFIVWFVCASFFLYEFLLRTITGTYQHNIMSDLSLTSMQFSLLSSTIFLVVYGLMQIPVGVIVDNIGLKKSLILGSICCSISSFGFANAENYYFALICRMFMGFGASFGFIGLLISVNDWMPHKYNAIFIGLSQFIGTMGPMGAAGPLDSLSQDSNITWRYIFIILSIIGLTITFLSILFVENNQKKAGGYIILYRPEKINIVFRRIFFRPAPWLIAVLSAGMYFAIEYLSANEGRNFLVAKGISPRDASYMLSISWIGYAVGCPLFGFLSDMLERRKSVISIAAIIGLLSTIAIVYLHEAIYLQISFFMLGVSASGQSICFALVSEQFQKQYVAAGFGFNNAMITSASAVLAPSIGLLLDTRKTVDVQLVDSYMYVFKILILMSLIAVIISMFFIKETYCKSAVNYTVVKNKYS